jgi:pyridoxine 5-phosphate synthase
MNPHLRLGVNIDHVATIRNARGGRHPDPVRAAEVAVRAGADGITAHLREDRRHISDEDISRLRRDIEAPLNLEMAASDEMLRIALRHQPHAVCLVPERREERTTEGGLDAVVGATHLAPFIDRLVHAGIRVTLFIEPSTAQVEAAAALGAHAIELHTGAWCHADGERRATEIARLRSAALCARRLGVECHAGHGLNYENVMPVAAIPEVVELNIGHFLIGEAIFRGLEDSIAQMRALMDEARRGTGG